MNYGDTLKYALETIVKLEEFYIEFDKNSARMHLFTENIAGVKWYNVASEYFNGKEYVTDSTFSADCLKDFKHIIGVCWHHIMRV